VEVSTIIGKLSQLPTGGNSEMLLIVRTAIPTSKVELFSQNALKLALLVALIVLSAVTIEASAQVSYSPLEFRQVSGTRPFVEARMDGKPFSMMVHSNASFYAMTTHDIASSIGLTDLQKKSNFGIKSAGHVDGKGRAETTLNSLQVANVTKLGVRLSVFEQPEPDMQGMLGIDWLRDQRVIVDYDQGRLGLAASSKDTFEEDQRILSRKYVAHAMRWDSTEQRFYVFAEVNGKRARLTVSTVANDVLEMSFAHASHFVLGPSIDHFDGPGGSVGNSYLSKKRLSVRLDGQEAESIQPEVIDFYAYNLKTRPLDPADTVQGNLGADFMLANQAIIDFGSGTLFLPTR
jgi:hypothetical protein